LKHDITEKKKNHFELGDNIPDMKTTNRENFIYESSYKNAKTRLDEALKLDLRATHYKLGYINNTYKSTHEENYTQLPYSKSSFAADLVSNLKKAHFDINGEDMDEMNRKTIYMLDFNKK
jgi:hypothetical protein